MSWIRAGMCVLVLVVLLAGPVARQLLGVQDERFRSWEFASTPPPICELGLIGTEDREGSSKENRRRIQDPRQARRIVREICAQTPDIRVSIRCASKRGWKTVVAPTEDPCR